MRILHHNVETLSFFGNRILDPLDVRVLEGADTGAKFGQSDPCFDAPVTTGAYWRAYMYSVFPPDTSKHWLPSSS